MIFEPNTFLLFFDRYNPTKILHKIPLYRENESYAEKMITRWTPIVNEHIGEERCEHKIIRIVKSKIK